MTKKKHFYEKRCKVQFEKFKLLIPTYCKYKYGRSDYMYSTDHIFKCAVIYV